MPDTPEVPEYGMIRCEGCGFPNYCRVEDMQRPDPVVVCWQCSKRHTRWVMFYTGPAYTIYYENPRLRHKRSGG